MWKIQFMFFFQFVTVTAFKKQKEELVLLRLYARWYGLIWYHTNNAAMRWPCDPFSWSKSLLLNLLSPMRLGPKVTRFTKSCKLSSLINKFPILWNWASHTKDSSAIYDIKTWYQINHTWGYKISRWYFVLLGRKKFELAVRHSAPVDYHAASS